MQEVTIKPRSFFKHALFIKESRTQELMYSFNTRKNNIKFGIYVKRDPLDVVDGTSPKRPESLSRSPTAKTLKRELSSSTANSPLGTLPPNALAESYKSIGEQMVDSGLEPVLPLAHYQSSKATINGSYLVKEPGTYFLVFDNTFSVKTSKKLFFSVAIKDIEPTQTIIQKEIEGWVGKKGNRAMQGYQKRWVIIESNGVLTYFKTPGSICRGYANLKNAAVHIDHNHRLLDVDSGQDVFHFKFSEASDFRKWIAVVEKFVDSKSGMALNAAQTSYSSTMEFTEKSTSGMEKDVTEMNNYLKRILDSLSEEIVRMKNLSEASKGRIDNKTSWKDFQSVLYSITSTAEALSDHVIRTQNFLDSYHTNVIAYQDTVTSAFQLAEAAYFACLNDNNRIREQFGLENVRTIDFIPAGYEHIDLFPSLKPSTRPQSIGSYEEFFDAESGDEEDESDYASDDSSFMDDLASSKLKTLNVNDGYTDDEEEDHSPDVNRKLTLDQETTPKASSLPTPGSDSGQKLLSIKRRTKLPHPTVSMESVSLMSIMRNNVGKDLSRVAMPIALNEPLNLLQRLCEELEYCDLLEQVSKSKDPLEQITIMAGFVLSGYANTIHRAGRKPFNPLLGETYECIREDKGFKFISEKVSHHPPVMACYAEGRSFKFYQDSLLKTKFWGKSMELVPVGTVYCEFPEIEECFSWNKATTAMKNVFSSGRYLEHQGTCTLTSRKSGYSCEITFKESGYFSSAQNEVNGKIQNPMGNVVRCLSGRWEQSLSWFEPDNPNSLNVVWRAQPHPPHFRENYGFTEFAIELNELTEDMKAVLPCTDTRFRPDQRLYENGKCDEADKEKERLENLQRERRRQMEVENITYFPKWFKQSQNSEGEPVWVYAGGYFEQRGAFKDLPYLW